MAESWHRQRKWKRLGFTKVVEIRPVKAKDKSDIKAKEKSDMTVNKFLNKLSKCEKKEAVNSLLLKEKSFFEELKSVSHGDYLELKAQVTIIAMAFQIKEKKMDYDNNLRGALFPQRQKVEGSNQPDYTGNMEVEGTKYNMAGWMREAKSGIKYMSVSLSIPEPRHSAPPPVPNTSNTSMDDEILFFKEKKLRSPAHTAQCAAIMLRCVSPPPNHAHHIQFSEHRGIGQKVGDQWTVPLCGLCHHKLHTTKEGERCTGCLKV